MRLFMFELLSPFGDTLERCSLAELIQAIRFDADLLVEVSRLKPGHTMDLPGFENAVMLRRVS